MKAYLSSVEMCNIKAYSEVARKCSRVGRDLPHT